MSRGLLRRLAVTVFFLWSVVTITFLLIHLTPGDPVDIMLGERASHEDRMALKRELNLDRPLSEQYLSFVTRLGHGDLGQSYLTKKAVSQEIGSVLPMTLLLAATALLFSILVGLPLGVAMAARQGTPLDWAGNFFAVLGLSTPSFVIAPILVVLFSIKLDLLPVSGNYGWASLILPTVSLGLPLSAVLARMTRASFLEVLSEDYIRTAHAKGLDKKIVFFKHAFRNALTPIATTLSFQFGAVLTGVVITETIFDWPGLGVLLFGALQSRNYPLVQGCVLTIAFIYIAVNLLTDVAYVIINPRLRSAS